MSVQACATIKERPMLFSGAMVRAILEGRKTQTRRIATFFNEPDSVAMGFGEDAAKQFLPRLEDGWWKAATEGYQCKCPYGTAGDRLWVKETFSHLDDFHGKPLTSYRATDENPLPHWKPSIFMRRIYSRITLEIVAVRVERLQGICGCDAIAEGIEPTVTDIGGATVTKFRDYLTGRTDRAARQSYQTLWESINGPGSWERNPWVWVVEFRRLNAPESLTA